MEQDSNQHGSETRSKITPYAFRVAPQLLETPLARPWRRGIAMLIDLIVVGCAAVLLDVIWAMPVFILLWMIKQHLHGTSKRLALIAAFILLPIVAVMLSDDDDLPQQQGINDTLTILSQVPSFIALNSCSEQGCFEREVAALKQALAETSLPAEAQYQVLAEALQESPLSAAEISQLLGPSPTPVAAEDNNQPAAEPASHITELDAQFGNLSNDDDCQQQVTPMVWLQGAMKDLGIGFSWAIAYFTVLPAWFNGQTIGKRLLRTQVVRLDGQALTAWGCFGRYGGYVAGLATGMLGFLQIYWDPNRQAIQDRIAATAVIYRKRGHQSH
ncbi:RDD family protein [Neiella sp. HB171785]|uniref:RDD family protein n=1 Tax=Neiella litorisoli TaxID=2771431 RepID=A0A8J6UDK9_9GAMM|nr:RDD family protein [Neiella litorisoli]MBD1388079.1 RDD family protein [Neiella litorisoli]